MKDRYQKLVNTPIGRQLAGSLGLPRPAELRRHRPGDPLLPGPAVLTGDGRIRPHLAKLLDDAGVTVAADGDGVDAPAAVIHDATGVDDSAALAEVYEVMHRTVARIRPSGRIVVFGTPPGTCEVAEATAQQALEGLVRSVAKELRGGATAQLVRVHPGAEEGIDSTLRFLLSGRSAYVSGQVITIGPATDEPPLLPADWDQPLADRVAVVTGAAQGIGAAIAGVLARDGAHVVCLDLPSQGEQLSQTANRIGGAALQLDITAPDAPRRLVEYVEERHGGVDVIVHNAGITRDKTVVGMDRGRWDAVIEVNLRAQERLTTALVESDALNPHGGIVCVSSVSGIAGNRGQTNYAASKAGIIGLVTALAPQLAERPATINAVAPGFIETDMTAEMPLAVREVGRRMNSLNQGGRPVDVAETCGWLASPATGWVNGQTVRVCGQSLIGA